MEKNQVILRADAGPRIGYGHFVRSLALALYLSDDFDCCFASYNHSGQGLTEYQRREIGLVCKSLDIQATTLDEYNEKFLGSLRGQEIVVLDNYYYKTEYQRRIRAKGCRLVCVDSMRLHHFVADAVITCTPLPQSDFSLEPYTRFVNGLDHCFLRPEFLYARRKTQARTNPAKVVLAMGGADPFGLTDKLIPLVHKRFPGADINVIVGDAAQVSERYTNQWRVKTHRCLSAQEIVELFTTADLGIFPASTMMIEALACQLPVAAGWYVDNQKPQYDYGVERKLFAPLGSLLDGEPELTERLESLNLTANRPVIDFIRGRSDLISLFHTLKLDNFVPLQ